MRLYEFDSLQPTNISGHDIHGNQFAGIFGTKQAPHGFELIKLDEFDKSLISPDHIRTREARENIQFFRYETDRTRVSGIRPLIKLNLDRGLAYFLTERSFNGEIEHPEFRTKGIKAEYIRICRSFL